HQALFVLRAIAGDLVRIEIVECRAEIVALAQDGDPGKTRLESIQHQFFVKRAMVIFRHAPFVVVIRDIDRVFAGPVTANDWLHLRFALRRAFRAGFLTSLAFFGFAAAAATSTASSLLPSRS